ncbi:hypothetical protein HDU67_007128 [Dinochytrium kinnereticum]|nr:hypothetical protein HDU67_007128 [Dinochytrium kinnereticum]
MTSAASASFFAHSHYAVVGASADRAKFGNKVLRWYIDNKLDVIPVNPKSPEIESIPAVTSLAGLTNPSKTSVSVITPPAVTLGVLREALSLGIPAIWLQPGCESPEVRDFIDKEIGNKMVVLLGGPCILVSGEEGLRAARL